MVGVVPLELGLVPDLHVSNAIPPARAAGPNPSVPSVWSSTEVPSSRTTAAPDPFSPEVTVTVGLSDDGSRNMVESRAPAEANRYVNPGLAVAAGKARWYVLAVRRMPECGIFPGRPIASLYRASAC